MKNMFKFNNKDTRTEKIPRKTSSSLILTLLGSTTGSKTSRIKPNHDISNNFIAVSIKIAIFGDMSLISVN